MGKIYKGWELMKAIADGEIKEESRFRDTYSEYIYKRNSFGDLELKREDGEELTSPDYSYFVEKDNDFELIQDEIDIDRIEELNDTCYDVNTMSDDDLEFYHNKTRATINEILQAVKQIDKRVKELEGQENE